eukprot:jgi/Psemu1/65106/estExt_Genemark1.C_1020088
MKFFPSTIVALIAIYSAASAVDAVSPSRDNLVQSGVQSRQLGSTFPTGTTVSYYDDNQWYDGVIQKYQNGIYTIKWDDEDEIEEIEAGPEMNQMVEDGNGDDDAPPDVTAPDIIAIGTPAFIWEDDQWFDGKVTDHSNGEYTVTWSDGDVDTYLDYGDDLKELKQAVQDALAYDDVVENDDDGSDENAYDDDATGDDAYGDDATGDDASGDDATGDDATGDDATGDDAYEDNAGSPPTIAIGTPVSIYEDGEWVDGAVTKHSEGTYTVVWSEGSDDEYVDEYDDEGEDFKSLLKAVENGVGDDDAPPDNFKYTTSKWAMDTVVRVEEEGSVWYGRIDDYSNNEYLISWDDGESEWIDDVEVVRQMVSNAKASPKGMSAGGKVMLSLFFIVAGVLASFYTYRGQKTRRSKSSRRRDSGSETVAFKDRPPRGEANYYKKQSENLRIV